jgi:hypothetical protein
MHPAIFVGLVIVLMFALLTTLVLLVDGRRSVEGDKQDEGPNEWL